MGATVFRINGGKCKRCCGDHPRYCIIVFLVAIGVSACVSNVILNPALPSTTPIPSTTVSARIWYVAAEANIIEDVIYERLRERKGGSSSMGRRNDGKIIVISIFEKEDRISDSPPRERWAQYELIIYAGSVDPLFGTCTPVVLNSTIIEKVPDTESWELTDNKNQEILSLEPMIGEMMSGFEPCTPNWESVQR